MDKVLVVEDSRFFSSLLKKEIESRLDLDVIIAGSFAEAQNIIESEAHDFFLSLLDLTLPDSSDDEIVDYILGKGMSAIVFTGNLTGETRKKIIGKNIIDYVLKDNPSSLDYVVSLVDRLKKNAGLKALVVDDSSTTRHYIATLLKLYRFDVLEAENGAKALGIIEENPDLSLVITDYDMPEMNGVEMIKKVRATAAKTELPIIALSTGADSELPAQFIKIGANDFLTKPFLQEEFFYRINQTIEFAEQVRALRDMATKDYLTGLYNRRYVMDVGNQMIASTERGQITIAVAMMDIDFFKKVNDTYGHEAGDLVLKAVSDKLSSMFRGTDVVGRLGGEEFAVITVNLENDKLLEVFDRLRQAIEDTMVDIGEQEISCTISIGVCTQTLSSLEEMLNVADGLLYEAKETGRNKVIIQS